MFVYTDIPHFVISFVSSPLFFLFLNGNLQLQTPFSILLLSVMRERIQGAFAELKDSWRVYNRNETYQRGTVFDFHQSCGVI